MYLLRVSEDYPEKLSLIYDHDASTDLTEFRKCHPVSETVTAKFSNRKKIDIEKLKRLDYIQSDGPPLISQRMAEVIKAHTDQVELSPASVMIDGQMLDGYFVLNILTKKPCFDLARSEYRPTIDGMPEYGLRFYHVHSLPEKCLEGASIVRAQESLGEIFVSSELGEALTRSKISGLSLLDAHHGVDVY